MVKACGRCASHIGRYLLCALAAVSLMACNDDGTSSDLARSAAAAPTISGSPTTQVSVGQAYSFTPSADEATSGVTLGFSVENKPSWTSFNVATGQLTGTPSSSNIGTYPDIVITVSNGTAHASLPAFTITVTQAGTVTLSWEAPTTNTNGTPITNLAGYTIDYGTNAAALSQTVTVDDPTTTAYTVQNLTAGTWYFAITAYTSAGAQSSLSNVVSTTVQ